MNSEDIRKNCNRLDAIRLIKVYTVVFFKKQTTRILDYTSARFLVFDEARKFGEHEVERQNKETPDSPITFAIIQTITNDTIYIDGNYA